MSACSQKLQSECRPSHLRRKGGDLLKESRKVDDHAVPHHTFGISVQDAGRHQMQLVLDTFVIIDRVPSICSTLECSHKVRAGLASEFEVMPAH